MISRRAFLAALSPLPFLPLACSSHPDEITLQGSGATFPAPLYKRWFLEMYRHGVDLGGQASISPHRLRTNYQPIGSGAGTRQFREGLTHFGASDDVKDTDVKSITEARGVEAMALPVTAGTIVLAYNLPSLAAVGKVLLLTRDNLLRILLGEITEWSDKDLLANNPDLNGYHRQIIWTRRSDSSGTTGAFTKHVGAVDPKRWPKDLVSKAPSWPNPGVGAKGNDGVSAIVSQTPGALGYIEFGYARLSGLAFAAYQNAHGEFVQPKRVVDAKNPTLYAPESVMKETPDVIALATAKPKDDARSGTEFLFSVADPKVANAYPIATYTWLLLLGKYSDEKTSRGLGLMLRWCLGEGQKLSEQLDYVPLPVTVVQNVSQVVDATFPA